MTSAPNETTAAEPPAKSSGSGGVFGPLVRAVHGPVYRVRIKELVRCITPHLRVGDHVLDVGCGSGTLGRAIADAPSCPANVVITGLERFPRPGASIPVAGYDGITIPLADRSIDVVIVADVLHHDPEPLRLLRECARITRRFLIIKDHKVEGPLAQSRISLADWAANVGYGVPCLFQYNTPAQWKHWQTQLGLNVVEERTTMNLYPPIANLLFGRRLQYLAVLAVP